MTLSPNLSLPYLQPSQAQKHVTHNEALQLLDAAVQLCVRGFGSTLPPAAPAPGDVHAVGTGATGPWAGQDGRLALWDGTGWLFLAPREGFRAWDPEAQALRVFAGGVWTPVVPPLQHLDRVGIGTASDAVNRLAVASAATLLTHDGAGHQLKLNKAAPADTASLLFQSGWTGHAEMGLAGGSDFGLKVSDGAAWRQALAVDRATGRVTLPQGATIQGNLGGSAVQASPTDVTPGRLLTAGAFGLGGPLPLAGAIDATEGSLAPGLHGYDTAQGSSGGPASVARAALLHTRRGATGGETQLLVVEAASGPGAVPGQVLGRSRGTGAWSAWTCGSLQESGSNANGRWVRHQDGTQTCWGSLATSSASEATWTYPAPFLSTAGLALSVAVIGGGIAAIAPRASAKTATSASFAVFSSANARVAVTLDLVATGRWS